jgi:hypothetical protein
MVEKAKTEKVKKEPRNMIFKFLRDKHGSKRGVVAGVCDETSFAIGMSCANLKAGDLFDKKQGLEMAEGRAWKALKVSKDAKKVTERAARLLKGRTVMGGGDKEISPLLVDVNVPGSVLDQVKYFEGSVGRYFKGRVSVTSINGPWFSPINQGEMKILSSLFDGGMPKPDKFTPPSLRQKQRQQRQMPLSQSLIDALKSPTFEDIANNLAIRAANGEFNESVAPAKAAKKRILLKKKKK